MKAIIILISIIFLASCRDEMATDVYIFNNTTDHVIDMVFYESLVNKNMDEYTTVKLDKRSSDNSIFTSGRRGNPGALTEKYDSVLVTYDDTIHIIHPSQFGKPLDFEGNQILNYASWIFIQATVEKKKHHKRDLIYTFTEEDYLNAL